MERGVSLMTLNHKKNVKDFSERKIIAHSWLIKDISLTLIFERQSSARGVLKRWIILCWIE